MRTFIAIVFIFFGFLGLCEPNTLTEAVSWGALLVGGTILIR